MYSRKTFVFFCEMFCIFLTISRCYAKIMAKEDDSMDFLTMQFENKKILHSSHTTIKNVNSSTGVRRTKEILKKHFLCGTGTTARMITEYTGLPVKGYNSGPLGGDQQIGAKVVEGQVDFIIFFSDPLTAQPHDPDVKALLRIARFTISRSPTIKRLADFMITSPLMDEEYEHDIINFHQNIKERAKTL